MFRNREKNASNSATGPASTSSAGGVSVSSMHPSSSSNFLKPFKATRKVSASSAALVDAADSTPRTESGEQSCNSRTLIMVFSTLDEFAAEREVLRNHVLPELQQYCSERDVDLECLTLYETGDLIENFEQFSLLQYLLSSENSSVSENTHVLCFVGDRYGETMLPVELRTDEFAGIQTAALELSGDVKLLDQFYAPKKNPDDPESSVYRLKPITSRDPNAAKRLCKMIQKGVKKAFNDGTIHQINENRQDYFSKSFIESFVDLLMEHPTKHFFVTRKLIGYQADPQTCDRWIDSSKSCYAKVSELKNRISAKFQQLIQNNPSASNNHFPFIFNLANSSTASWLHSKEFAAYERQLAQKLSDHLKQIFSIPAPHSSTHFAALSQSSSTSILDAEHSVHEVALTKLAPPIWVERPTIDAKLTEIVDSIFSAAGPTSTNYFHFYGGDGVGKTATLCRLHRLIQHKIAEISSSAQIANSNSAGADGATSTSLENVAIETKEPPCCIVMTRFVCLTECAMFANELFRNIFLKAIELGEVVQGRQTMIESFHFNNILLQADAMMEHFKCPLVLLIDDVQLIRYGSVLSKVEKPILDNFNAKLTVVMFSASAAPPLGLPPSPQLIEIPPPSLEMTIEILKIITPPLATTHVSVLRQNLYSSSSTATPKFKKKKKTPSTSGENSTANSTAITTSNTVEENDVSASTTASSALIMGQVQREELLDGQLGVSVDLNARFALIELRCGAENARIVCQLLCCCAPFGITRMEVFDAFRLRKRSSGMSFEPDGVMSASASLVLKHLGCLLVRNLVNNRELWTFAHASVLHFARMRYLQSTGEVKLIHETLANIMNYPPTDAEGEVNDAAASCLLFPQPICRENGAVNLRRVRFHWYYLLYTGDISALKSQALCSFEFLEAAFRGCGLSHLLSIFEECLQQILDHDLLVIFEKVLIPSIPTLIRDGRQFVSEFLNRLRYTRSKNNIHLNNFVEQAMQWTDNYSEGPLLVPLTCWIPPPRMKQVISFPIPDWKSSKTVLQPTFNHQHLLISGNDANPGLIYMYHIASQHLFKTLHGHESRVSSICTSRDGQFFVSCAYDGSIKVWNFSQSEECIKTLKVSNARILCSLLSADDKWIVTGSVDSSARVISIESGAVLRIFRDHTGPVVGLQLSSDNELLVTGSGDFVVMVWDIEKSTIILKMGGLMAPVTCLAITSNDAFLAVACEDETLRVFSMVSSQELHELSGHDSRVNALAVSSDDCQLFAATRGKILIYDIHNGQLLEVLHCLLQAPITSLKISVDNSFVLAACGDRVHMWNMNSIEHDSLQNDRSALACICISPDEKGAGCGTIDGILAYWDLDVCQCMWTSSQQKSGSVTALDFTVDSLYLLSGNAQGGISMWEVSTGQLLKYLQVHNTGEVSSICCLADGFRVLSVDKSFQAQVWSLSSYADEAFIYSNAVSSGGAMSGSQMGGGFSGFSNAMQMSSSAYHSGGGGGIMQMGSSGQSGNYASSPLAGDDMLATVPDLRPPIFARYSARAEAFVVVGQNARKYKEVNIWSVNIDSRVVLKSKAHHNQEVVCYHLNRSGTALVTGSLDLSLKVWQTDSGFLTQVLVGHTDVITCCCITEDGRLVASGGRDQQIIVWDVSTGTVRLAIPTRFPLIAIEISQDGSVMISADKNGWIEAWETSTGHLLSSFNTHRRIQQLIMGVDGNRVLARLSQTAQLPILCLHNTPATLVALRPGGANERKVSGNNTRTGAGGANLSRLQSASSFTSDVSAAIGDETTGSGLDRLNSQKKNSTATNAADEGGNAALRPASALSTRSRRAHKDSSATNAAATTTAHSSSEKKSSTSDASGGKHSKGSADAGQVNGKLGGHNRKSAMCMII